MTAQIDDTVVFNRLEYALTEYEGSGLFDPEDYGFEPSAFCTACWRGFVCEYEVTDQRLLLTRLQMGLSGTDSEKARILEVFGKDCSVDSSDWSGVRITGCSLPIPFDGTMLIGRDFIRELYVHMGFHPAYKYKEVWELEFERGRLISKKDVSKIMKTRRQKHVEILPEPSDTKKLSDWIADTFSRRKRDKS